MFINNDNNDMLKNNIVHLYKYVKKFKKNKPHFFYSLICSKPSESEPG